MVLIFFQLLKRQRLKKNWWQLEKQAWITTMNMLLGQYNKSIYVNTYSWQNELSFLWLFIVEMHFMIFIPLWMKKWGRKFQGSCIVLQELKKKLWKASKEDFMSRLAESLPFQRAARFKR